MDTIFKAKSQFETHATHETKKNIFWAHKILLK